jgi:hypothetical protein
MRTPSEVLENLSEFQLWAAGKPRFDLIDYAMCSATADLLCSFLELVEPQLIQHNGHYFIAHQFDTDTYETWKSTLSDSQAIQRVMNHIHISSLLQEQEVSDVVAVHIAQGLARCWSRAFGHLGLKAEAYGSSLEDAQVTLFEP